MRQATTDGGAVREVEVLGVESVTIHPTPEADAYGWSEAFGSTPQLIPVEMVAHAKVRMVLARGLEPTHRHHL